MRAAARLGHGFAVVAGALLLLWPALLNGYPLLYPDSISYLGDGRPLARILLLHAPRSYTAMRSEFYSLGILPFHWNGSAWPIVALQALLTAYILWLTVRSLTARRTVVAFFTLIALLSLTTSLAWYASFVMPDILGPLVYLAIYLLVFANETLSTPEKLAVAAIAAWGMAAHSTHLMLAAGLCVLLTSLLLLRFPPLRPRSRQSWIGVSTRARPIAAFAALILLTAAAQTALHGYLYGEATLFGNRMPYTLARVVADGPGRWYLQAHCATQRWAICSRVADLPDNDDDFLWTDGGIWDGASPEMQRQMLDQEWALVLATIRAYPGAQLRVSLANFGTQLTQFGLWDFTPNPWMAGEIDKVLPGALPRYLRSREAQSRLPNAFFTDVQVCAVIASTLAIFVCVPLLWRRRRWRVLGLTTVLVPVVLANAFLTAVLSEVDTRYQARVIWLIPLLAGLMALDLLNHRREQRAAIESS